MSNSISRTEGKEILENQNKILKDLKNVRDEFRRADNLFCSCHTMLNLIKPRLEDVKKMLDLIESTIKNITKNDQDKLTKILNMANEISIKLKNITITNINSTLTEITARVVAILKKGTTTTPIPKDIIQKLDDIICMEDSIITTIDSFAAAKKDIVTALNSVECSLNNIGEIGIKGNLVQMKNNLFDNTMIRTIILIIIIAILTALSFLLLRGKNIVYPNIIYKCMIDSNIVYPNIIYKCMFDSNIVSPNIAYKCMIDSNIVCPNIIYKYMLDPHVLPCFILIILALAGIWALAFIYIKSRLKVDEQDSTAFRKSLDDDC